MSCTEIRMQSLPIWQKIEVSNTLSVCFQTVIVLAEHCVFCFCEVLTHCHQYSVLFNFCSYFSLSLHGCIIKI